MTTTSAVAPPVIHERKRPFHFLWYVLAALVAVAAVRFIVFNPRWEWAVVGEYLFHPRVLAGLGNTIQLTIVSSLLGLAFGVVVAACRMSNNRVLKTFGGVYIWLVRAVPTLVMLLFIFFLGALIPEINIGLPFLEPWFSVPMNDIMSRWSAAVIGLAFFLGGFSAEIFRGGLLAVSNGQWEAADALGMSRSTALRRVVMPQAIRVIIPPLANELITMFKNTSLVSVIGYVELLTTVQQIYSVNFLTIPLLTVAVIWYLALTSIALLGQRQLEKRFGKGFDNAR
ncbi:polar amino acid ABC transporter permease [Mycolicibacterium murale]|uniref:Polar amino acid ABC transporter permease n=1 Tax=Mycolicibacterium murale TaxID=182220 RepID=A0A7I9WUM4_9MYCO|nr:amino acid ABC transporter permease [Mycolicibacterium murale]GFG61363.1 polar amino acid ABC transporter permease [Mycolicibacterium murale]